MRKLFGILLIIASFTFLVWKFLSIETSFMNGMLLNILGFLGISLGLYLAGWDFNQKQKTEKSFYQEEKKEEETPLKKESKLKDFDKDDHDRFMPK